jgi:carboxyl-terminal processing protease
MTRFRTAATAALIALPIVAGGFLLQQPGARQGTELFSQVASLVANRYVDSLPQSQVFEKAARGLVNELNDPYSELMSPKEREDFSRGTNGRYGGTGMYIGQQESPGGTRFTVVDRVFPHTPAEDAGVVEGDRIVAVDGQPTAGLPLEKISERLRGVPGTKVTVTYARPGVSTPLVFNLTRREIHIPAVLYSTILGNGVGYVPLQTFNENASQELVAAVQKLQAAGAKSLIIDLRDNPGGIVEQSLEISSLFLRDGQGILTVRTREGAPETESAQGTHLAQGLPLTVLVDDGSASASEIVAGALQDHDRALIVGTTTYGKGLVQGLYQLAGGYALKLTTGKWYTPVGRSIHRDRKLLADGRYVEVQPDSLEKDSVRTSRPTFKSDGGRTVYGGGGITPDVIIPTDTLSTAEQEFARWIAPKGPELANVLRDYSLELKGKVAPGFTPSPEWTTELFRRLEAVGVTIEAKHRPSATKLLTRDLEVRVARQTFGDAEVRRRTLNDDQQLRRAVEMMSGITTQEGLLAKAKR